MSHVAASDVLVRARDLLTEYGWSKHAFARDDQGLAVPPVSAEAVSFCPLGAVTRAASDLGVQDERTILACEKLLYLLVTQKKSFLTMKRYRTVAEWNDLQRSVRPVVSLFEQAHAEALAYETVRS